MLVLVTFKGININLYRELRAALAEQYSDTNKWNFDSAGDIGDLSDYQIRQMVSDGGDFMWRIIDLKVSRPYIILGINSLCISINYCNPLQISKIMGKEEAKNKQDL